MTKSLLGMTGGVALSLAAAAMLAALASCGKEEAAPAPQGQPIAFTLGIVTKSDAGPAKTVTTKADAAAEKTAVTKAAASSLAAGHGTVIVNGKVTSGSSTSDLTHDGSSDLVLAKESQDSDRWFPGGLRTWEQWQSGAAYSFLAYAYSPSSAKTDGLLGISGFSASPSAPTSGTVTISQPDTYTYGDEDSTMVDYLFSHRVYVADGSVKPVVRLRLEHALSLVEIYVVRDPSIDTARVRSLGLAGFYTSESLVSTPLLSTSDEYNSWTRSYIGTQDGDYVMSGALDSECFAVADDVSKVSGTARAALMRLYAVPQSMSGNALVPGVSVRYDVNEVTTEGTDNWQSHDEETFSLGASGLPQSWEPGWRYVYVITIDTGIRLTAHVAPWQDGGVMEATILPEI